jgi:hypothetical protein
MLKKQFNSGTEAAMVPTIAKSTLKRVDTLDQDRNVQGASESTANECSRGIGRNGNGSMHCRNFSDRYALVICI